jgi:hypothetical protein
VTLSQQRAIAALFLILAGVLAVRHAFNPAYVSDPESDSGPRAGELLDRVDPNSADWPQLAALPGLGEALARRIVDYRREFLATHTGRRAFERLEDLENVKGIGRAMLANLQPYLHFPPDTGSPRP